MNVRDESENVYKISKFKAKIYRSQKLTPSLAFQNLLPVDSSFRSCLTSDWIYVFGLIPQLFFSLLFREYEERICKLRKIIS